MSKTEIIRYGDIERFRDVGSLLEFYDRLGLSARFGPEDICHVDQFRISFTDHQRLRDLIHAEVRRREPPIIGRIKDNTARTDWFNRGPLPSDQVPEGELWIVQKTSLAWHRQETIVRLHNLNRKWG